MSDAPALTILDPEADAAETRNVVLYGPPGIGKTTNALTTPGPVLMLNAEGRGGLKFARRLYGNEHIQEVAVNEIAALRAAAIAIRDDGGKTWKSVVIDTIGEVYRVLVEEQAGVGKMPEVQHYGNAGTEIERFVRFLRDQPVNLIILAHEELIDGPSGPLMMPQCGGKKLAPKVCAMVDDVGYVGIDPGTGDKPERTWLAQLAPTAKRYAKNRGGALGPVRKIDVAEWIKAAAEFVGADNNETGKKVA